MLDQKLFTRNKALFAAFCFFLLFQNKAYSQALTYDTTIQGWNARITYYPAGDSTEGVIFIPGAGEVGTDRSKLLIYGPHYWLKNGWDGSVTLGNGKHYPILISLQQPVANSRPTSLKPVIDAIMSRFKIKKRSLHFTALSQGSWVLNEFLSYMPAAGDYSYMSMVRSMVNVQGMNPADTYGASLPFPQKMGHWAKKFGGKQLGFEQTQDTRTINKIISNMNDSMPGSGFLLWTTFGDGGHTNFNDFYNPSQNNWTLTNPEVQKTKGLVASIPIEGSQNIWQWMLRQGDTNFVKASDPETPLPANKAPVANAGSPVTITLPINLITLSGSGTDSDGTIKSYEWSKISGPSTFSISAKLSALTTVINLIEGTYQFELKVTDDKGAIGKDTVSVTVKALISLPPSEPEIPSQGCQAKAGSDQKIMRGQSFTILDGSQSVGTELSYKWKLLTTSDFEFKANIRRADSAKADVMILPYNKGGYDFELVVSDGKGCTSKDTVNVFVNYGALPPQSPDSYAGWHYATSADVATIPSAKIGDVIIAGANTGAIPEGRTEIYIYNTSGIKIGPGQKVLIKGGKYGKITLNFPIDGVVGSREKPILITNYGGQVECQYMTIYNAVNAKITGKYVSGVSGDINYQGHTKGAYAFSRGKYGIYCNNGWSSLASGGLKILGPNTDSLEIEYVEVANGNFAGMIIKEDGGLKDYNGFYIHDCYIHDIHGEGMYLGSNASGYRHRLNGWKIENVRIVNAGNEIFQMDNQGNGNIVQNNVFINSATNWKSPFGAYQDNGIQITYSNGNNYFRNNIALGLGNQTFNFFNAIHESQVPNNDTIHIENNLLKYGRGFIGANFAAVNPVPGVTVAIDSNYFGGYRFRGDEVYLAGNINATNTNILLSTNGTGRSIARKNISDGSKSLFTKSAYMDVSGTTVKSIANPRFVNSGWPIDFDWNALSEWADSIYNTWRDEKSGFTYVKHKQPVIFNKGDYVLFLSKVYKSKLSGNIGHMPHGVTDEYWELQTWTDGVKTYDYPPDDYRLQDGDEYKAKNIGLTEKGDEQPRINVPPVADAGTDITITLPVDSVQVTGIGYDSDGSIKSYSWTKLSGPEGVVIRKSNSASTIIAGLKEGVYSFEFQVSDNEGAIAKDMVKVTVNAAPVIPTEDPVANAGVDQTITLPAHTVTLDGNDSRGGNGSIVKYEWKKLSGPEEGSILSATTSSTQVSGLAEGVYVFELTITNNSNVTATDQVKITVLPEPNIPPVANAGEDIEVTLPIDAINLNGAESFDPDGSIITYSWTKISGPSPFTILSSNTAKPSLPELKAGTYVFELTVYDSNGATATDRITIKVNPAVTPDPEDPEQPVNQAPNPNPGINQTIMLPATTADLDASGSIDPDGTIVGYKWEQLSGPSEANIAFSNAAQTSITGLVEGEYVFEVTVTDDKELSSSATVKIIVVYNTQRTIETTSVYPVPANSFLKLAYQSDKNGNLRYNIFDSKGLFLMSKIIYKGQFSILEEINISSLSSGLYFLELRTEDAKSEIKKFIVQR